MLRWPVKSALYIDFENVPMAPDAIGGWLAWLEDGCFEPLGRRRRFVQKRVYWNSHAERHRKTFEAQGFSVALVGKYSGLKNGADIRMAMDIVEATYARSEIDEYILLDGRFRLRAGARAPSGKGQAQRDRGDGASSQHSHDLRAARRSADPIAPTCYGRTVCGQQEARRVAPKPSWSLGRRLRQEALRHRSRGQSERRSRGGPTPLRGRSGQ